MSEPTIPNEDRQRRLEEAMAEYLIATDAGRPPEPESFLARYPDLRAELVEFMADLSGLAALVEPLLLAGAIRLGPGSAPERESTLPLADESTTGGATTSGDGSRTRPRRSPRLTTLISCRSSRSATTTASAPSP
jgi:hypothetical protein